MHPFVWRVTVLAVVGVLCASPLAWSQGTMCDPPCATHELCAPQGVCVSRCNPACGPTELCSPSGECVSRCNPVCATNELCSPAGACLSRCNPRCTADQTCTNAGECVDPVGSGSPPPASTMTSLAALAPTGALGASAPQGASGMTSFDGSPAVQAFVIRTIAGVGYTMVDFADASEYPSDQLESTDGMKHGVAVQLLWAAGTSMRFGGEAGWEQLYSYSYAAPYGTQASYGSASWSTAVAGGLAQFFLGETFYAMTGADLHFFIGDAPALGISAALGAEFHLSSAFSLPLELRVKTVFGAGTPTVVQVNAGAAF